MKRLIVDVAEQKRLNDAREAQIPWKKWGPYLSERQWGTVREDYSADGNAWDYFSHDQSRSRAYRWGEDGLGGISDDKQRLCFALVLWNERDPILKERLFGLTNSEGNHGEDVKEYYFYLDSTPTHSYMKYLYKYPQREFPYRDLVETNRRRTREEFEYELLDPQGKNVFAGGFLGLDNIGVFDRSSPLPTGGSLEQADGTAWMAFYAQNMLEMAVILADINPVYQEIAFKFLENVIWISYAMHRAGEHQDDMWDEQDGFYYDVLRLPNGEACRLKVRSMVGLLPLCASTMFEGDLATRNPKLLEMIAVFRKRQPEVLAHVAPTAEGFIGHAGRRKLSPLTRSKLERILACLLDEQEFLGPHGIRSLSRHHLEHPFVFRTGGQEYRVQYLPAESTNAIFGGNSNWRGPVWMPVNVLLIRGLVNFYSFYGNELTVECPTGSGNRMNLFEVAREISRRLAGIFLRDASGRRPVYDGLVKFQSDPHWRDLILFHEYFHGDNGAGLGASHQTGWTGFVAALLDLFGRVTAEDALKDTRERIQARMVREQIGGK